MLSCSDQEKDFLLWRLHEPFAAIAKKNGDDTLHFSGFGHFLPHDGTAFEVGHFALTDQHLYVLCDGGEEVRHKVDVTCVLDLTYYEDVKCLRIETDEGSVVLKNDSVEQAGGQVIAHGEDPTVAEAMLEHFMGAFYEEVLPLEVLREASFAVFAAEAKYDPAVTRFLGLTEADVEAHKKVDAVELLEMKRKARLEEDKRRAAEEEVQAQAAKEEFKKKIDAGRADTQAAHEKGMRRLSMKRRRCEHVQREVNRWLLAGKTYDTAPPWWVGPFSEAEDPYVMPEDRVNEMADNLAELEEKMRKLHLEKLLAVCGECESQETSTRRAVDGEARIAFAEIKEKFNLAALGFRELLKDLKRQAHDLIRQLEQAEFPERHRLEAEEEAERFRLQLAKANNNTRLDSLAKLLRSTLRDEERMREEVAKLELRTREDVERREQKECRRAAKLKMKRERGEALEEGKESEQPEKRVGYASEAQSATPQEACLKPNQFGSIVNLGERNLNRTLLQRTQSVHRRNLLLRDTNGRRKDEFKVPQIQIRPPGSPWDILTTGTGSSPSPYASPRSPRSFATELSADRDLDARSSGSSSTESDLSYYERVMLGHLQSPTARVAFRPKRRVSPRPRRVVDTLHLTAERTDSPYLSATNASGHLSAANASGHLSASGNLSVPSSPATSTAASLPRSFAGVRGQMSPRGGLRMKDRRPPDLPQEPSKEEKEAPPPPPPAFEISHTSNIDKWRDELRSTLGVKPLTEPPARRAVVAAAAAVLAISAYEATRLRSPSTPYGAAAREEPTVLAPSRWSDAVLATKPQGQHSLVYTYTPVKTHPSFSKGTSVYGTPRTSPRNRLRSTATDRGVTSPGPTPPPTYARHLLMTTPTGRPCTVRSPASSVKQRSPSPRRNRSPLRGGGEMAGAYVCAPQPPAGWYR